MNDASNIFLYFNAAENIFVMILLSINIRLNKNMNNKLQYYST